MILDLSNVEAIAAVIIIPNGTYRGKVAEASFFSKDSALRLHLRVTVKHNGEDGAVELPPISLISKEGKQNSRGLSQLVSLFQALGIDSSRWKKALDFSNQNLVEKIQAEMIGRTLHFRFKNELIRDDGTKQWADYTSLTAKQYAADLASNTARVQVENGGDSKVDAPSAPATQPQAPVTPAAPAQSSAPAAAPTPPAASDDVW